MASPSPNTVTNILTNATDSNVTSVPLTFDSHPAHAILIPPHNVRILAEVDLQQRSSVPDAVSMKP